MLANVQFRNGRPIATIAESGDLFTNPIPDRAVPKKYRSTLDLLDEALDPATYSVRCNCGIQSLDAKTLVDLLDQGASGKQVVEFYGTLK